MKRFLCAAIALVCAVTLQAQEEEKDVTKFLGIPVDGYKPAMIEKLKAKGFTPTSEDKEILEGEFNGTDVYVFVVTNNNKVCRIAMMDKNGQGETDIKIRFNTLCRQFENNSKYIKTETDQAIPEDEDISFEMTVNKKRYQASFYQNSSNNNNPFAEIKKSVWFMISESYGKYHIAMFYDNEYNKANGDDL